ncbi:hypothetical protein GQ44DRAFT_737747 [Phaeosphaeriaceae sp. PMI808]|nr:hypothetical protein GQ44DRAFT_737747 [Phaeosphaeriaceae sp. PMI808]
MYVRTLTTMEQFINTQLHPAETCLICTEAFNIDHQPVTLPCYHIFGHLCIKRWLRTNQANSNTCPSCRLVVYEKRNSTAAFDISSIWNALCEHPSDRLHFFITKMWCGIQALWLSKPDGKFTVTELLNQVIIPALVKTANPARSHNTRSNDPFIDCYNLIAASWDSLGRPDRPIGLAIPLVRLARLMSSASCSLPKWLTTVPRTNRLFWRANACLGITEHKISWEYIVKASQDPANSQHLAFLHLYTMIISQIIAHNPQPIQCLTRKHELMNFVVERCCTRISGETWVGKPSNEFKQVLVVVHEELKRYQLMLNKSSLRGHDGEDEAVKGIWALATWSVQKS